MHSFKAVTDVELSLTIGDYVVVRKVLVPSIFSMSIYLFECAFHTKFPVSFSFFSCTLFNLQVSGSGWAEGECKGKAGWFPFNYVERRERVLASKVADVF